MQAPPASVEMSLVFGEPASYSRLHHYLPKPRFSRGKKGCLRHPLARFLAHGRYNSSPLNKSGEPNTRTKGVLSEHITAAAAASPSQHLTDLRWTQLDRRAIKDEGSQGHHEPKKATDFYVKSGYTRSGRKKWSLQLLL